MMILDNQKKDWSYATISLRTDKPAAMIKPIGGIVLTLTIS